MDFEEMIYKFADEHPVWTWILARLIICICGFGMILAFLFGFIVLIAPIVIFEDGSDPKISVWLWLPFIAMAIWVMWSIIKYVYTEVIE